MPTHATGPHTSPPAAGRSALFVGGVAAILASTCCLGPLVLLMLGFSGAWIGNLTVLEPYRPLFVVAAVVALVFAYRQIFRPTAACTTGEVCAVPRVRTTYKALFAVAVLLTLTAISFPYLAPLFY